MGKYFVTIAKHHKLYKVCRDDINKVFSCRIGKVPKVPAFHSYTKTKEDDMVTLDQDFELQFEPIQFFPISNESQE